MALMLWWVAGAALVVLALAGLWKWGRRRGPFTVRVREVGGRVSRNAFDSLFEARCYADDAASEEGFPTATIYNRYGWRIGRGYHYAVSPHTRERLERQRHER